MTAHPHDYVDQRGIGQVITDHGNVVDCPDCRRCPDCDLPFAEHDNRVADAVLPFGCGRAA